MRTLRAFLQQRMRLSHIYQPLMLKTLLQDGRRATVRQIAAAFLAEDQSQLEYGNTARLLWAQVPGRIGTRP